MHTLRQRSLHRGGPGGVEVKRYRYPYRGSMNADDRDRMRAKIMNQIRKYPGITEGKLIELIGRSDSVVTPFLHKLVRSGAIVTDPTKRRQRAYYIKRDA
jgi:hypothetical protein